MSAKLTLPFEETLLNKHTTRCQDLFASNFKEPCGTQHESSSDWVAHETGEREYAADESGEAGYADQVGRWTHNWDEGWDYPTSNVFLVVLQSGDEIPIYKFKSSFSFFDSILYYMLNANAANACLFSTYESGWSSKCEVYRDLGWLFPRHKHLGWRSEWVHGLLCHFHPFSSLLNGWFYIWWLVRSLMGKWNNVEK